MRVLMLVSLRQSTANRKTSWIDEDLLLQVVTKREHIYERERVKTNESMRVSCHGQAYRTLSVLVDEGEGNGFLHCPTSMKSKKQEG